MMAIGMGSWAVVHLGKRLINDRFGRRLPVLFKPKHSCSQTRVAGLRDYICVEREMVNVFRHTVIMYLQMVLGSRKRADMGLCTSVPCPLDNDARHATHPDVSQKIHHVWHFALNVANVRAKRSSSLPSIVRGLIT